MVDGIVSDEKLDELLHLQTEYPELDYKTTLDLRETRDEVELAKDIGAMQVRGGYIVAGVDGGVPTGAFDEADPALFDEANLIQKMLRYLPEPLVLRTRVTEVNSHRVALIYVGRNPAGCAFFKIEGKYRDARARETIVFRPGDVFWRDGTRSTRMTQRGFEELMARLIVDARAGWLVEQREIRQQEAVDLEEAYQARQLTEGPLGSVNLDMPPSELIAAALDFIRRGDDLGLRYLINEASARARRFIQADDIETELGALLDSLACVAAAFMEYEQWDWFDRIVESFRQIYSMPLGEGDARTFGYSTRISPDAKAPRVWLQIMERVYALGALAVRLGHWSAVRTLTLQRPDRLTEYETNWLRHAITMISRAQHLQEEEEGRTIELSLLNLARATIARLDCLRPDGLPADDDEILTSLAQFDVLSNIVAVVDGRDASPGQAFYPNFARFRQDRTQPVVDRLIADQPMRQALGIDDDDRLALALNVIGELARNEGWRYHGFMGWVGTPAQEFITEHKEPPERAPT